MKTVTLFAGLVFLYGCNSGAEKGKEVFVQQCATCHDADSTARKNGPGLKDLFRRARLTSNGKEVTRTNVRAKIEEGGNGMPPFDQMLSKQEKDEVLAYLQTL